MGIKRPWRGADYPPTPVKRRGSVLVELYLYLPSVLTWHVKDSLYLYLFFPPTCAMTAPPPTEGRCTVSHWMTWSRVFLTGAFAELRKATISCVMSVCPSIRLSVSMQLDSHWTGFQEISYFSILRKSDQQVQLSLKSDKNNRYQGRI